MIVDGIVVTAGFELVAVKRHTLERLDSFVVAVVGKRLTYKELTA